MVRVNKNFVCNSYVLFLKVARKIKFNIFRVTLIKVWEPLIFRMKTKIFLFYFLSIIFLSDIILTFFYFQTKNLSRVQSNNLRFISCILVFKFVLVYTHWCIRERIYVPNFTYLKHYQLAGELHSKCNRYISNGFTTPWMPKSN